MRSTLLLTIAILLGLGILFARDRLRRALQVGALLYAIVLAVRFVLFSNADPDNLLDIALVAAVFGVVWLIFWGITTLVLRRRDQARSRRR